MPKPTPPSTSTPPDPEGVVFTAPGGARWTAIHEPEPRPAAGLVGTMCVVALADGARLVRVLRAGTAPGRYDLHPPFSGGAPDRDVPLAEALLVVSLVLA